jgi:hypothetical protein
MSCQHLSYYRYGQNGWAVASCTAKDSPYVPSLCDLEKFCQNGRHALCPFYLLAALPPQDFPGGRAMEVAVGV